MTSPIRHVEPNRGDTGCLILLALVVIGAILYGIYSLYNKYPFVTTTSCILTAASLFGIIWGSEFEIPKWLNFIILLCLLLICGIIYILNLPLLEIGGMALGLMLVASTYMYIYNEEPSSLFIVLAVSLHIGISIFIYFIFSLSVAVTSFFVLPLIAVSIVEEFL